MARTYENPWELEDLLEQAEARLEEAKEEVREKKPFVREDPESLMDEINLRGNRTKGGFIHVPAGGMPPEKILDGLKSILDCVRSETEKGKLSE